MRLRVLSYNIHRAIGVDRRFRPERIARILEAHDPDVVLLQEVDEGVPRSREMNLAR
jgi:endonuclease/exonuclease/phosphatase family metal-dependent hydrolase